MSEKSQCENRGDVHTFASPDRPRSLRSGPAGPLPRHKTAISQKNTFNNTGAHAHTHTQESTQLSPVLGGAGNKPFVFRYRSSFEFYHIPDTAIVTVNIYEKVGSWACRAYPNGRPRAHTLCLLLLLLLLLLHSARVVADTAAVFLPAAAVTLNAPPATHFRARVAATCWALWRRPPLFTNQRAHTHTHTHTRTHCACCCCCCCCTGRGWQRPAGHYRDERRRHCKQLRQGAVDAVQAVRAHVPSGKQVCLLAEALGLQPPPKR
jgi:hypothetical protein